MFNPQADFEMGAFAPPVRNAGDTCYISDHTDIAIGLNSKSPNAEAAKTFLSWVASPEFATSTPMRCRASSACPRSR